MTPRRTIAVPHALLIFLFGLSLLGGISHAGGTSPEPAFLVKDITPSPQTYPPQNLTSALGRLYFRINFVLWQSDGTEAGTVPVNFGTDIVNPSIMGEFQDQLLILSDGSTNDQALFMSNGTPTGATLLLDNQRIDGRLGTIGNYVYFIVRNTSNGADIWRTDGTASGTAFFKTINPTGTAGIYNAAMVGSTLYFVATDGVHGTELWKSDGTPNGTTMVKDISQLPPSTPFLPNQLPGLLTPFGNKLLFAANDGTNGLELWISDGTADGTQLLKDMTPGSDGSFENASGYNKQFTTAAGKPIITVGASTFGARTFWTTDGTPEGTQPFYTTGVSPFLSIPVSTGNLVFFTQRDTNSFDDLWRTDGTTTGTQRLGPINPDIGAFASELTNIDGTLLFSASDGSFGHEVWRSNGTTEGTTLVADVNVGDQSSNPQSFMAAGDFVFFTADDGVHGRELWAMPRDLFDTNAYYSNLPLIQAP